MLDPYKTRTYLRDVEDVLDRMCDEDSAEVDLSHLEASPTLEARRRGQLMERLAVARWAISQCRIAFDVMAHADRPPVE